MIIFLIAPYVQVLTFIYTVCSFIILGMLYISTSVWSTALNVAIFFAVGGMLLSIIFTVMVLWLENKEIKQLNRNSLFSFWFYLISWIPINIACLVRPIDIWEPIEHTKSVKISQLIK